MDFDLTRQECSKVGGIHDGLVCLSKDEKRFEGKHQSMSQGTLVKNPNILFNIRGTNRLYGDFDASTDHFDRIVAMENDLSIGEQDEYLEKHKPTVDVFYIKPTGKNGIVKKKIFHVYKKMHWKELGEI